MTDRLAKLEFAQSAHFKNQSQDLDNLKNAISFYVLRNSTNSSFDLQKTLHQLRSNLSFIESTLEIMQKNEPKVIDWSIPDSRIIRKLYIPNK